MKHCIVVSSRHLRAERVARPGGAVRTHRNPGHAFDSARDGDVVAAGHHALRGKVRGLLAGAALPVDGGAGNRFRKTGRKHRIARDVVCLLAHLPHASGDHVVDQRRIEMIPLRNYFQGVSEQVDRMPALEPAVPLTYRRTNRINNDSFAHAQHHIKAWMTRSGRMTLTNSPGTPSVESDGRTPGAATAWAEPLRSRHFRFESVQSPSVPVRGPRRWPEPSRW